MGRKLGVCPLLGERGSWVPTYHNVASTEAHLYAECHLDPSTYLVTIDMGQKWKGSVPFWGRGSWVAI